MAKNTKRGRSPRRRDKGAVAETAAAQIERLTVELAEAHRRLDAAFNAEPRGEIAKHERLTPYLTEAQTVLDIIRRIQKLKSD